MSPKIHWRSEQALKALQLVLLGLLVSLLGCGEQPSVQESGVFDNPIVKQRADPWVYRTDEGRYYFTGMVPEANRIELRSAMSLNALGDAEPVVIWRKHPQGPMSANIWGPKLHRIEGVWYLYFSAGSFQNPFQVQMYVLSNPSEDPLAGEWQEEGRLVTSNDSFALTPNVFEHRGQRYLIWSQTLEREADDPGPASLFISALATPTELTGPEIMISTPTYDWEKHGIPGNLGPNILIRNDKLFATFTAGSPDHRSTIGLVWANAQADPLKPDSWHKLPEPVLSTHSEFNRYGPGQASFTKAEDGATDAVLYHSREYRELQVDALIDPNRHTRARILHWDQDGWPSFEPSRPD